MAVRDMGVGVHVGLCLDGEVQVGSREGGVVECVAMQGVVWSGVMQDGTSPLLNACSRGDTAIVKVLLSSSEVNTNIVGRVSWG